MTNELSETGGSSFSVVVPVHNEAAMLVYTLPSIWRLKPKEVIFVLDRCTDQTEKVVRRLWDKYSSDEVILLLFKVQKISRWRMHLNFLYDFGIRNAKSKIVLLTQADTLHDYVKIMENIRNALHGMVSFAALPHPHISPWNYFLNNILQLFASYLSITRFSGVIAINKQHYLSCSLTAKDLFNFDTQLKINFEKKPYNYTFVLSKNLNLRPWVRSKLWNLGVDKYKAGSPLWKVLLFSCIRLMPEVITGYLHAKHTRKPRRFATS